MKSILVTISLLIIAITLNAQHRQKAGTDSVLIKKYEHDTLAFKPFARNGLLLDSIHPKPQFTKWELNVKDHVVYHNIERFPRPDMAIPDTVVLSRPGKNKGFMVISLSPRTWYMSALKGNKTVTIQDMKGLSRFLGAIDNPYDAYLWLFFRKSKKMGNPGYKTVEDGFLISGTGSGGDMAFPDKKIIVTHTYLVGFNKKVEEIRTQVTVIKNPYY